jgi:hypothetical protein
VGVVKVGAVAVRVVVTMMKTLQALGMTYKFCLWRNDY